MEQRFDKNYQPKIPVVYLGTPSHRIVCAVNGIREETFNLEDNLTDTKKISFDVDKYVEIFEKKSRIQCISPYRLINEDLHS